MTLRTCALVGCVAAAVSVGRPAGAAIELEVECSAAEVGLVGAFSGTDLGLERAGRASVRRHDRFELAFLSVPGCRLQTILPALAMSPSGVVSVTAAGDILHDGGLRDARTIFFKPAGGNARALPTPRDLPDPYWLPVLSDDGRSAVWSETRSLGRVEIEQSLRILSLVDGSERRVPLAPGRTSLRLIAANAGADQFVLLRHPNEVRVVDGSGNVTWGPVQPTAIDTLSPDSFRRIGPDWVAWSSGSVGAARLQWSTRHGSGQREFRLATLTSVAVDPDARFIAATTSGTALHPEGEAVILRVEDGREFFRRPLPQHSRARVAFLGASHVALDNQRNVDVLRLPPPDWVARAVVDAAAAPTPPVDVTSRVTKMIEGRARSFGLTPERPGPETKRRILGRWKLVGMSFCAGGEMPFLEFGEDGFAYDPMNRKRLPYVVGDQFIQVGDAPGEGRDNGGHQVFQMSGGFYVPSFECGLWKLERADP